MAPDVCSSPEQAIGLRHHEIHSDVRESSGVALGWSWQYAVRMHILIINFNLNDLGRSDYEAVCDEVAEAFAGVPGLVSKHWLANDETNTFGGVYVFQDQQAMLDYKGSELFSSLGSNPAFVNITATDFEVLAGPSRITHVT